MSLDLLLDPVTGDLPALTRLWSGLEIIAQRVQIRTLTHRGDWPLDRTAGIDWQRHLSTKPADVDALAAELATEWRAVPGVVEVTSLTAEVTTDGASTISAELRTETGETIVPVVSAPGVDGNPSIVVGGVLGHSGWVAA